MCDNVMELVYDITKNCDNDLSVVQDECKAVCLVTLAAGVNECANFFDTNHLLTHIKDVLNFCYYKLYPLNNDGH